MNIQLPNFEIDEALDTAPLCSENTLGGRINEARENHGLTTGDLAATLGITPQTLANWQQDRDEPRANKLIMLAGILNVSPTWLMTGNGLSPSMATAYADITTLRTDLHDIRAQTAAILDRIDRVLDRIPE